MKIPCVLVVESAHVHPLDFDGSPIVVALGLGPVAKSAARSITRGLKLF
jgi:hypothetical protein